jgi:hypothetical protein
MRSTAVANLRNVALPAIGRQLVAAVIGTAAALLLAIAALFLMRRLAGAFVVPLGGFQLLGATAVLILVAALIQFAAPRERLALIVPAMAAAAGLTALTLPGTAPWSVGLAWFALVVAECAILFVCWKRPRIKRPPAAVPLPLDEPAEEPISEHLVQQLTRESNANGGESLHALVRVSCTAGDRLAVVHLAFCPPLAATPKLTAHALDDSGAEAKVTLAETYGARIELRLPDPASDGDSVLLEVVGQSSLRM